jgi:hypothetical protein
MDKHREIYQEPSLQQHHIEEENTIIYTWQENRGKNPKYYRKLSKNYQNLVHQEGRGLWRPTASKSSTRKLATVTILNLRQSATRQDLTIDDGIPKIKGVILF